MPEREPLFAFTRQPWWVWGVWLVPSLLIVWAMLFSDLSEHTKRQLGLVQIVVVNGAALLLSWIAGRRSAARSTGVGNTRESDGG